MLRLQRPRNQNNDTTKVGAGSYLGSPHQCIMVSSKKSTFYELRNLALVVENMRPFVLVGHERPITWVMYNREGDLLFTCAKDPQVCLWDEEDGSMMGTYDGHTGAVNTADVSRNTERLITASSDASVRLWDVQSGKSLWTWTLNEPCRACSLAVGTFQFKISLPCDPVEFIGDRIAAFTTDKFITIEPSLRLVDIEEDVDDLCETSHVLASYRARVNRLKWSEQNTAIIAAHEDGYMRKWNSETGQLMEEKQIHEGSIADMRFSTDMTYFLTASNDKTASIVDSRTFEVIKVYKLGSPVNAADISPTHDYIVLGGGQEAVDVAVKGSQGGIFESRFFHKIYAEEFGRVRGHFGPINALAFHPSGRGFTSGSEEGYVRVHKFDDDYFTTNFF